MTDSTDINQLPPVQAQPQPQISQGPVQPQQYNPNAPELQPNMQAKPVELHQSQPSHPPQQPIPQAPTSQPQVPPSEPLSQDVIQQLIQGVQQASLSGATKLPSRDIPQDTSSLTMDTEQQPNYVPGHGQNAPPSVHNQDYIEQYDTMETMLTNRKRKDAHQDRLNQLYEEVQTPILVVVLFFIFQLPFVSKTFKAYMPNLWIEGKPTLGAYLVQASLFGATYYGICQGIHLLSQ